MTEINNFPGLLRSLANNIERGYIQMSVKGVENMGRKQDTCELTLVIQGRPRITVEDLADIIRRAHATERQENK